MDNIGIYDDIVARRDSILACNSQAVRHRILATPVKLPQTSHSIMAAEIKALKAQVAALTEENAALRQILPSPTATDKTAPAVMDAFCHHFTLLGGSIEGGPITIDHLRSTRRNRQYAAPRHVCIWLIRLICHHLSLPQIGKIMGNRDHSTAMHGLVRASFWLSIDPDLKQAAHAVLAQFGAQVPE